MSPAEREVTEDSAAFVPWRACCGQQHLIPQCPDGKVMCCLCFDRFDVADLHVTPDGTEDVCKMCWERERWDAERRFLDASIAVWREVDRLTADGTPYPGISADTDLRVRERAAWEVYRSYLASDGTARNGGDSS